MVNLLVFPLVGLTGVVTGNLTELVRGESADYHPNLKTSSKAMSFAVLAYVIVWFGLLVSGISISSDIGLSVGIEYLGAFLVGLLIYTFCKLGKYVSDQLQLWIYRIAFPLVLVCSFCALQTA